MRFFDPALQRQEQNAKSLTPDDVWVPFNVRAVGVAGNPNNIADTNDSVPSNSINFQDYLSYVLARNTMTANIKTSGSITAVGTEILLGSKIGVNMNSTADQLIPITLIGSKKYRITRIGVTNASISLTTAAGGVYQAASKAGTAIVATQGYSSLTAATTWLDLTLAISRTYTLSNLYFALSTPQGAAATADVYVFGVVIP